MNKGLAARQAATFPGKTLASVRPTKIYTRIPPPPELYPGWLQAQKPLDPPIVIRPAPRMIEQAGQPHDPNNALIVMRPNPSSIKERCHACDHGARACRNQHITQ